MVMSNTKTSLEMKNEGHLGKEKIVLKIGQMLYNGHNFFITIVCSINIYFIASKIYVDPSKDYRCIFHFILSTCKYFL